MFNTRLTDSPFDSATTFDASLASSSKPLRAKQRVTSLDSGSEDEYYGGNSERSELVAGTRRSTRVRVAVKPFTVEEEADEEGVIMQGQELDAVDDEIIDQGAKDSAIEDALLLLGVSNELFEN
jgi:hypothetical protein